MADYSSMKARISPELDKTGQGQPKKSARRWLIRNSWNEAGAAGRCCKSDVRYRDTPSACRKATCVAPSLLRMIHDKEWNVRYPLTRGLTWGESPPDDSPQHGDVFWQCNLNKCVISR